MSLVINKVEIVYVGHNKGRFSIVHGNRSRWFAQEYALRFSCLGALVFFLK